MRLGYYPIELLFWYDGGWAADAKIAMSCVSDWARSRPRLGGRLAGIGRMLGGHR